MGVVAQADMITGSPCLRVLRLIFHADCLPDRDERRWLATTGGQPMADQPRRDQSATPDHDGVESIGVCSTDRPPLWPAVDQGAGLLLLNDPSRLRRDESRGLGRWRMLLWAGPGLRSGTQISASAEYTSNLPALTTPLSRSKGPRARQATATDPGRNTQPRPVSHR